ncbi:Retrovirus-related Pol polyprotein from transposon opus [Gossypium australe]|uniref:Retrovirus-related Pol polyprotein from transposon opus n=1 Tax=Gossypium australe TaxID=47621 RepID=A0A5B6UYI0_9ROSI|nr:Retrovirus-related Pol polyprotein from transposon opus [Gossypium australe]
MLMNKLPLKLKDPRSFTIPCSIGNHYVGKTICDLGATINLIPMSTFKKLGIRKAKPTIVTLQLANRSYAHLEGKIEDVLEIVDKFTFPTDFIILECKADKDVPIILGRPFLATVEEEIAKFCHSNFDDNEDLSKLSEAETLVKLSEIMETKRLMDRPGKKFESLDLSDCSFKPPKLSIEEPPTLELKPLLLHSKYAYLGDNNTRPVVISAELKPDQEVKLLDVLRRFKKALRWKIVDIEGIIPAIGMHKILLEDCHNNCIEQQRRLNLIMKEVVKKEVLKWLDC